MPVSFSAFSTLFIASSIDAGPKRGSETLVCVFSFNVVDAIILLLYVTDVFANLLIISFTTNFLFQKQPIVMLIALVKRSSLRKNV